MCRDLVDVVDSGLEAGDGGCLITLGDDIGDPDSENDELEYPLMDEAFWKIYWCKELIDDIHASLDWRDTWYIALKQYSEISGQLKHPFSLTSIDRYSLGKLMFKISVGYDFTLARYAE